MEKKYYYRRQSQSGQTLVVLLMFVTVAMMVTLAATLLSAYSLTSASNSEQTQVALGVAESGMENALLRLLRDPSYTGETLVLADGTAVTTVTGSLTKTIISVGTAGNFKRTITVTVSYTGGILSVISWVDSF